MTSNEWLCSQKTQELVDEASKPGFPGLDGEAGIPALVFVHRAAGGEERHSPNRFTRTEAFLDLLDVLTPEMAVAPSASNRGGSSPGTFVVKELVYALRDVDQPRLSPGRDSRLRRAGDAATGRGFIPRRWLDDPP